MQNGLELIGRFLVLAGVVLTVAGILLIASSRTGWLGKLPGDILIQRKNYTFYFPITTAILISLVLSLIFWIVGRK